MYVFTWKRKITQLNHIFPSFFMRKAPQRQCKQPSMRPAKPCHQTAALMCKTRNPLYFKGTCLGRMILRDSQKAPSLKTISHQANQVQETSRIKGCFLPKLPNTSRVSSRSEPFMTRVRNPKQPKNIWRR